MGKFLVKTTATGFVFNLKASNGETIGVSEVYTRKASCMKGVSSVMTNAPVAGLEDQTANEKVKAPKFEIYTDKKGEFRFRMKAKNGQIILASEGYKTKTACQNGVDSVRRNAPGAKIEEVK